MKLRVLLLAGSIATNAALVAALHPDFVRHILPATGNGPAADGNTTARVAPTPAPPAAGATGPTLWSALETPDLTALVGRLRAAGFPPYQIYAVVEMLLRREFNARSRQLLAELGLAAVTPYWKPDLAGTPIQQYFDQTNQLGRARFRRLRELLGDDYFAATGADPAAAARQGGNIPRAKLDLIDKINADYSDMRAETRTATQGISLPEDREKFALLDREQRADIAAVLTPEERAEFEVRSSGTTSWLRGAMTTLDASEDEFRKIYAAAAPFNDGMFPGMVDDTNRDQVQAARQAALDQIKATLGEQRFAEFSRAMVPEYQQLVQITQTQGLPADAAVRTFALRDTVQQESNRIVDDATLTNDQKRDALNSLAQDTRSQINGILGPAAAAKYLETAPWVGNVASGRAVTFVNGTARYKRLPNAGPPVPRP